MTERSCVYRDRHNLPACTECGQGIDLCQCVSLDEQAHARNHSPDGIVIKLIIGELAAARAKFPDNLHQLAALTEEVGELAQAMIQHDVDGTQTTQQVLREAVQVAAMAIRVATEGDQNYSYMFPAVEEDLPRGPVADRF